MDMYFPVVIQVIPQTDYTVYVYFDDGKIVLYDLKPKLDKPLYKHLKNTSVFIDTCKILNGTLAWSSDNDVSDCIDIDPFSIHSLPAVKESIA